MVVDHADRLHEGVEDRRSHEPEAPLPEIRAEGVGLRRRSGEAAQAGPAVLDRFSVHEPPHVPVEASELLAHREKCLGVGHGGLDLQPIADNAGVLHERGPLPGGKSGNAFRIEAGEGLTVVLALAEDGRPG